MKTLHDLSFAEFADAIRPSGGMNRWPQMNAAKEVVTYTVNMNGDSAHLLPDAARDHEYRDVAVHALTEKLGLDPFSFRDNVKVAELLALRHAYLSTVLEASILNTLSPAIADEYAAVSDNFSHPWLKEQIAAQQAYETTLKPVLDAAESAIGKVTAERSAAGISHGAIVSQNENFTIQNIGNGVIVAHENRRLDQLPEVGEDVTVAYYRGRGQVIENMQDLRIGEPYVDQVSQDLAVSLTDASGTVKHVVMFNSMNMLNEFASEHQLGRGFVIKAMEAREAQPKQSRTQTDRAPIGDPYIDKATGNIALDFQENSMRYTAVFPDASELVKSSLGAKLSPQTAKLAAELGTLVRLDESKAARSLQEAKSITNEMAVVLASPKAAYYSGKVIADTGVHIVQDRGRNEAVIHDKRLLDKLPMVGENFAVDYKNGRGVVTVRQPSKDRQISR